MFFYSKTTETVTEYTPKLRTVRRERVIHDENISPSVNVPLLQVEEYTKLVTNLRAKTKRLAADLELTTKELELAEAALKVASELLHVQNTRKDAKKA